MEQPIVPGLESIFYGLDGSWQGAYQQAQPWWNKVSTKIMSSSRATHYYFDEMLDGFRKWIGERLVRDIKMNEFTLINDDWELTVGVDKKDLDDMQIGYAVSRAAQIGIQAAKWPDKMLITALQAGKTSLAFDGQNFFSASHPISTDKPGLGTYSNLHTAAPLSSENFETAFATFSAQLGTGGTYIDNMPTQMLVSPTLAPVAKRILESDLITRSIINGASTSVSAESNPNKGLVELVVLPELQNDPLTWYLQDGSKPIKGLLFQERKAPTFVMKDGPQEDELFWHKRIIMGSDARGAAGLTIPFLLHRYEAV